MRSASIIGILGLFLAALFVACGGEDRPRGSITYTSGSPTATTQSGGSETASPTTIASPTPSPTPAPAFPGMVISLVEGTYWDFRWQFEEESCAQGSGCSSNSDSGVFRVQLGQATRISGVLMYPVSITGRHLAGDDQFDLAPRWSHIGIDGARLVGSKGTTLTTIFDATTGEWLGGGFFGRFDATSEDHVAQVSAITSTDPFAEWLGVETGPAISVVRSDSQSNCEIVEGRRLCPNDSTFSINERQLFRDQVGPFGYTYRRSASFSGGGFFSSNSVTESVAVIAGSLLGDELTYQFESEPNQGFESSEDLGSPPYSVIGQADLSDAFEALALSDELAFPGHDFFDLDTAGSGSLTVTLTALSNTGSTIGFLVTSFDGESLTVELISIEESASQSRELMVEENKLYTVIVCAVITPNGPVDYVLSVE